MTYAGQLQKVVTMYLKKCIGTPAFVHGKPSKEYWQVRGFFYKQDPDIVNIVFDYLENKTDNSFISLYNVVKEAKKRQTELRWQEAKEETRKKTSNADAFSFDMLMGM